MADTVTPVTPPVPGVDVSIYGPYERMGIALIDLANKIIDSQPPNVKQDIWNRLDARLERLDAIRNKILDKMHLPGGSN